LQRTNSEFISVNLESGRFSRAKIPSMTVQVLQRIARALVCVIWTESTTDQGCQVDQKDTSISHFQEEEYFWWWDWVMVLMKES
jgi:hypothetical protein